MYWIFSSFHRHFLILSNDVIRFNPLNFCYGFPSDTPKCFINSYRNFIILITSFVIFEIVYVGIQWADNVGYLIPSKSANIFTDNDRLRLQRCITSVIILIVFESFPAPVRGAWPT